MRVVTANELVELELSAPERWRLLERADHRVTMQWYGRRICACFDSAEQAEIFRKRYSAFVTTGKPELYSCAVQAGNDAQEPVFWTEPGSAYRYPAPLRGAEVMAFLADAVTHRAFFDVNPDVISFHAAAIRVGNVAAALSAVSTGGKSTTAIACARRGMDLYTDERCVLRDGLVQPFPRAVNIRRGGLELLCSEEVPGDLGIGRRLREHAGAEWISAPFGEVFGDRAVPAPAKLDAIFFIQGRSGIAQATQLSIDDSIVRLLSAGLCGPQPGLDRVAAATALFRRARVYSLSLGSPDDTAMLVAATTSRSRPLVAVGS